MESFDFGLMKQREKMHKLRPEHFESLAGGVEKRLESRRESRTSNRLSIFDSKRNLPRSASHAPVSEAQQKLALKQQQLERWKEEKEKKKKMAAAQMKKPFLAGVPHTPHKYAVLPLPPAKPSSSRLETRSQKSLNHSFAPENATFKPPKLKNDPEIPFVSFSPLKLAKTLQSSSSSETDLSMSLAPRDGKPIPTIQLQFASTESESSPLLYNTKDKSLNLTRQSLRNPDSPILVSKTPSKSPTSASEQITPKNKVPMSECSSEERLRPSKSLLDIPRIPEHIFEEAKRISPCVTMSQGKDNARREMKKKLDKGLLDVDTADADNIDHFRRQLASEIKRMTETCELWDRLLEQAVLPDSIQESILAAVGQCRLLMSQKLQQFAGLVERCARPEPGSALVTPVDLHGFWDMVFMQIENVDLRFKKLEELRARNWTEEQVVLAAKKKVVKAVKAKPVGGASMIIKEMIAARKAKKDQLSAPASPASRAEKTFEAGFFCVTSLIRSPAPATPQSKLPSLLKVVQSSEIKKTAWKSSTSFAMLHASVLGKIADYDGISPLPQTPSRSTNIIKKATSASLDDEQEGNVDSGVSSIEIETDREKENCRKSTKLTRQGAFDTPHPMMTRSRRKSMATPQVATTSHENKVNQVNKKTPQENKTPQGKGRRSSRKAKVLVDVLNEL